MKFRPRSSRVTLVKPLLRQLNAIREAGRADGIEIGICLWQRRVIIRIVHYAAFIGARPDHHGIVVESRKQCFLSADLILNTILPR